MSSQTATQENSAAGIIPAAPWRIRALSVLPEYKLAVTFCDGSNGIVDCSNILGSTNPGIYAPLASPEFFAKVRLDLGALTWPNGADLDPGWLHAELADKKTWSDPNGNKLRRFGGNSRDAYAINATVRYEEPYPVSPRISPFHFAPETSFWRPTTG